MKNGISALKKQALLIDKRLKKEQKKQMKQSATQNRELLEKLQTLNNLDQGTWGNSLNIASPQQRSMNFSLGRLDCR